MSTATKEDPSKGWSNSAELSFIHYLADKREAKALLRGYLNGMKKRDRFDAIDRTKAVELANELLLQLEFDSAFHSRRAEVA
ncbi:hypothetical protein [Paraburkholderia caribensis]|uniref:hypothetical protein n=1 Tax=Paraburkholderia caribensis TaxID=75105 RepID=UPI001CACEA07|nr:hypothetical protein [Paraburkholderia caribensis]CAG9255888.1 conserved hypothetical protein [Paraburkholderia caribensis]